MFSSVYAHCDTGLTYYFISPGPGSIGGSGPLNLVASNEKSRAIAYINQNLYMYVRDKLSFFTLQTARHSVWLRAFLCREIKYMKLHLIKVFISSLISVKPRYSVSPQQNYNKIKSKWSEWMCGGQRWGLSVPVIWWSIIHFDMFQLNPGGQVFVVAYKLAEQM